MRCNHGLTVVASKGVRGSGGGGGGGSAERRCATKAVAVVCNGSVRLFSVMSNGTLRGR